MKTTKQVNTSGLALLLPIWLLFISCASIQTTTSIPTLSYTQYATDSDTTQVLSKSDVTIKFKIIQPPEMYNYPELFSFDLDNLPDSYKYNTFLNRNYPEDDSGLQWEFWFMDPEYEEQVVLCWVTVTNRTSHILRMQDARIYWVSEGHDPLPPIASFNELFGYADGYWQKNVRQYEQSAVQFSLNKPPDWFFRSTLGTKGQAYKFINIGREVLPGTSMDGLLAFHVQPPGYRYSPATVSFYDIVTQTDAAGNPAEKATFSFNVTPETIRMWYDRSVKRWKVGSPPSPTQP